MTNLTELPIEIIEGIMNAAHPMPLIPMDSRHVEQLPAAITFGAMRLTCRELNDKVFKRYVECLFSVHTVMLEEPSLQALLDLAKNERLRDALGTLFVDTRGWLSGYEYHRNNDTLHDRGKDYIQSIIQQRNESRNRHMFFEALQIFPNLKEITIDHATTTSRFFVAPRMICLGASAMEQIMGERAQVETTTAPYRFQHVLATVLSGLGATKKELSDLQIRIVCRDSARPVGDHIDWSQLEYITHESGLTTDHLKLLMEDAEYNGIETALKGLKTLALPVRGPTLDEDQDFGAVDEWEFGDFDAETLANFISLSPSLEDLTVYFATGETQATVDIKTSIPWACLPNLRALELGGARFDYRDLTTCLLTLKDSLRHLTLRHVKLASKHEWISLIRFLHTKLNLDEFELWELADSFSGYPLCFRNLKGKCYQPYRAWRVKKILPENLEKYLADLEETKLHVIGAPGCRG
jgi:hypothetical protein